MTTSVAVPVVQVAEPRPRRRPDPLLVLAVLVAVAPFVASAVDVVLHHRGIALGGDQAVLELATREAADGSRSVGAYSRYGWSHPGPLWFYLLAPGYRYLGSTSTGLYLSVFAFHAACAAALVLVAGRFWGASRALLTGAAVAATWAVLGPAVFLAIWNPYALVLPTVLFLLLAARAATGSGAALAGAALVGSFLVQTHVGTAVLVAAVGGVAALAAVAALVRRGRRGLVPGRATVLLGALTVLAWVPPLVQELRPGTGNLTLLWQFQRAPHDGHGLHESLAALGAQLLVLPSAGRAAVLPDAAAQLGAGELLAMLLAVVLPLALAVLARRAGRPTTAALALLSLVALAAALVSITQVEGTLYPYLVVWTAVLPVAPLLCAVDLLLLAGQRLPLPARVGSLAALPAVALAAALVVLAGAPPVSAESRYGDAAATPEVLQALGPDRSGDVRIRIVTSDAWPVASGLVLSLTRAGYDPRVTSDWTFMFGPERGSDGREQREVLLYDEAGRPTVETLPGVRLLDPVATSEGTTYLAVRDPPGDTPVPVLAGPVTGK